MSELANEDTHREEIPCGSHFVIRVVAKGDSSHPNKTEWADDERTLAFPVTEVAREMMRLHELKAYRPNYVTSGVCMIRDPERYGGERAYRVTLASENSNLPDLIRRYDQAVAEFEAQVTR